MQGPSHSSTEGIGNLRTDTTRPTSAELLVFSPATNDPLISTSPSRWDTHPTEIRSILGSHSSHGSHIAAGHRTPQLESPGQQHKFTPISSEIEQYTERDHVTEERESPVPFVRLRGMSAGGFQRRVSQDEEPGTLLGEIWIRDSYDEKSQIKQKAAEPIPQPSPRDSIRLSASPFPSSSHSPQKYTPLELSDFSQGSETQKPPASPYGAKSASNKMISPSPLLSKTARSLSEAHSSPQAPASPSVGKTIRDALNKSGFTSFVRKMNSAPSLPLPPDEYSGAFHRFAIVGIDAEILEERVRRALTNRFSAVKPGQTFQFSLTANETSIQHIVPPIEEKNSVLAVLPQFCFPKGLMGSGHVREEGGKDGRLRGTAQQMSYEKQEVVTRGFVLTNIEGRHFPSYALVWNQFVDIKIPKRVSDGEMEEETAEKKIEGWWDITVKVQSAMCLVSRWPYFNVLKECLLQIFREAEEDYIKTGHYSFESMIATLLQLPAPRHPIDFSWGVSFSKSSPLNFSMRYLFLSLDVDSVIQLFTAILCERQVRDSPVTLAHPLQILFVSSSYTLLTLAAQTIISLIYPFLWHHVYVPVLPPSLVDYIQAPTPFIMGIHRELLPNSMELMSEVDVVDLDLGKIRWGNIGRPIQLPADEIHQLCETLRPLIHPEIFHMDHDGPSSGKKNDPFDVDSPQQKSIRIAFFSTLISLMSGYLSFYLYNPSIESNIILSPKSPLSPLSPINRLTRSESLPSRRESVPSVPDSTFSRKAASPAIFRKNEFMCCQPEEKKLFLEAFMDTQAWMQFEKNRNGLFDATMDHKKAGNELHAYLLSKFSPVTDVFLAPRIIDRPKGRVSSINLLGLLKESTGGGAVIPRTMRGFHLIHFNLETANRPLVSYEALTNELNLFISGLSEKEKTENAAESTRSNVYHYTIALVNLKIFKIFAALQEIEKILEKTPDFPLEDRLIEYLHNSMEELENNPTWLNKTRHSLLTIGPCIRNRIREYGDSRPAVLIRRESMRFNLSRDKLQEDLAVDLKVVEAIDESKNEDMADFLLRMAFPCAQGTIFSPKMHKRTQSNAPETSIATSAVNVPRKPITYEEFITYCTENSWPYPKETIKSFFNLLSKKENKNSPPTINCQAIAQAFRNIKQRKPQLLTSANLHDESEVILMMIPATCVIKGNTPKNGTSGQLFLTNTRLIYLSKKFWQQQPAVLSPTAIVHHFRTDKHIVNTRRENNDHIAVIHLSEIAMVDKYQVVEHTPLPGLPCVRLVLKNSDKMTEFIYMITDVEDRDHWYRNLNEVTMVYRMSHDLGDSTIINDVMLHVLLTEVVLISTKKNVKTFLTHRRSLNWLHIKHTLERNALNAECTTIVEQASGWEFSEKLLMSIIEVFFSVMTGDDQVYLDLKAVESSKDYARYLEQVALLRTFDLSSLKTRDECLSFFINIYNALVIHAYLLVGFASNKWDWRFISRSAWYQIGSLPYTIDFIQHGILRGNNPNPWINKTGECMFSWDDPRFAKLPPMVGNDQRVMFILCTHHGSSPFIRIVRPDTIDQTLSNATKEYLTTYVKVSSTARQITLPKLFKWYKADFDGRVLEWVSPFLTTSAEFKSLMSESEERKRRTLKIVFQFDWTPSPKPFRQFL
ncbi:putative SET-binding factor [Planoprotostelium fungivorum]|uniref:Putative SET-binding factor n=1 Tax=Planoprotostelium fungivorum TaxID=1890364 RepID=A0A2P6MRF2_9EUKA|nr:putative SET-binding factor [Planoprotostelium fungivorum]